jgi:hypothetical protein
MQRLPVVISSKQYNVATSVISQLSRTPRLVPIRSCTGALVLVPDAAGCGLRRALLSSHFPNGCPAFDGSNESVLSGCVMF